MTTEKCHSYICLAYDLFCVCVCVCVCPCLSLSCQTVVIGNGTACRETEAFFADLIKQRFFQPLDVSYW